MHLINPQEIQKHIEFVDGFHHADWAGIWHWIEENIESHHREEAWNEAASLWLAILRDDLGGDYRIFESARSFLLADPKGGVSGSIHQFINESVIRIRERLGDAAWQGGFGKRAAIIFSEEDDFFQYLSHYSMEGEQASSGGVSIGSGFTHIALPWITHESAAATIVHELAHDSVAHLPLPNWLNEGVAQFLERELSGMSRDFLMHHELAERHFDFWTSDNIQEFWAGTAFYLPGDPNELAYSLAETLFALLVQDHPKTSLVGFLEHADRNDAGQTAALTFLQLDLGKLAGTFLGSGDWRPNRKQLMAAWELRGWLKN